LTRAQCTRSCCGERIHSTLVDLSLIIQYVDLVYGKDSDIMQPCKEMPLMAEWTRGSAGVQGSAGVSIGFPSPPPEEGEDMYRIAMRGTTAPKDNAVTNNNNNTQSQYATLVTGQDHEEEGTVQVVVKGDVNLHETDNMNQSIVSHMATKQMKRNESCQNGDLDSLSAVSKAVENSTHALDAPQECPPMQDSVKPTESLSSAAAGVFPGSYAAAIATAASLVSQNTGRIMAREDRSLIKSLSSEMPIDTNEALHVLNAVGNTTSHGKKLSVPGNSSNSGNHNQAIKEPVVVQQQPSSAMGAAGTLQKRRGSHTTRPPMRPPPNAIVAARGVNVALPTGSSSRAGGIHIPLDHLAHMAEDAVSTVQQPEFIGEVVCDAVSKASGDDGNSGDDDAMNKKDEYTESRVQNSRDGLVPTRRITRQMTAARKRMKKDE
jgi:hypothetical protein